MIPDKSLQALFNEALDRDDPVERARFLDEACGADPQLRERVEKLLLAHNEAGGFFSQPSKAPPSSRASATKTLPVTEKPGDRIGRYKLLQQIGEGGCGVVYMAEQEEPVRRRVALKVIKLGMDTKQVIARFEAERQALALMDHPNIAKVFDAGATETGRPYFVMELVRGNKITDFCDENKVSTADRLKLVIQICQAIQHAHQKGVIHRDIKPSNILVTINDGVPVPKVIDFGIAKATAGRLTDQTLFTAFEQFIGTPAYMSPEQAVLTSLDIDTRSDIYSLGVLLYELLTSRTPFDQKELLAAGLDEMRRTIREAEPPRPSTRLSTMAVDALATTALQRHTEPPKLVHLVRGDLDWIVMKCLEKDRARRYETANALATDIRRHLESEPVIARPPGRLYEFQKTVKRHKIGFAAAGAVMVALAIGLGVATWQFFEKNQAYQRVLAAEKEQTSLRQIAEIKEKQSEEVARFLKDMLKGVGPSVAAGRDTTMLKEILDNTARRLKNELTNAPEVEAELRGTIGRVYWELGQNSQAESMYRRSLELLRKTQNPADLALADTLHNLAEVLRRSFKAAEAEATAREALDIYEKRYGREHVFVGATLNLLGFILVDRGDLASSEAMLREALMINRKTAGEEHPQVGLSLSRLGRVLERQNKLDAAEAALREAVRIQRKGLGTSYLGLVDSHVELGWTLNYLSVALTRQGRLAEAEIESREAMAMMRTVLGDTHRDSLFVISNLADILGKQGKQGEVESLYRDLLSRVKTRFGYIHRAVDEVLVSFAHALEQQGMLVEAEAVWHEEIALEKKLVGDDHPFVANSLLNLTTLLLRAHRPAEAEPVAREALAIRRKRLGNEHVDTLAALKVHGSILNELQRHAEAEHKFREILQIRKESGSVNDKDVLETFGSLITIKIAQRQSDEVVRLLREITEWQRKKHGDRSYPSEESDPIYTVLNTLLSTRAFDAAEQVANTFLTPAIAAEPRSVWFLLNRGRLFARTSRFKEAINDFEKVVELEPANHHAWYVLATLLAESADVQAYDSLRRRMLARFAEVNNPFLMERTAKGCLLLPATGPELNAAAALARKSVASSGNQAPNIFLTLARGLAEYRQEHYDDAERSLRYSIDNNPWSYPNINAPGHLLLAVTLHRRGKTAEARSALAKGAAVTESWPGARSGDLGNGWHDLLIARTLLREATATVEAAHQP